MHLTAAGYASIHVNHRPGATATDVEIATLANELGAAVVSKDEDFRDLLRRGVLRTGLVWVRTGNVAPDALWSLFETSLPGILQLFETDGHMFEMSSPP